MTIIDGTRQAGSVTVPGHVLDRIDFLGRLLGRSPSEVIVLAFDNFAPPVEQRAATPAAPGDGRAPAGSTSRPAGAVLPHVHIDGGPCVYDECDQWWLA